MQQQQFLLENIKTKLAEHTSLEHELARLLAIDLNTAFKIVRYQKALTFDQAIILAQNYSVPLDSLNTQQPSIIPFQFNGFHFNVKSLDEYFAAVLEEFNKADLFGSRRMIYAASEIPLFTLFQFPEIAAFKLFFWGKTVYDLPAFQYKQFAIKDFNRDTLKLGEKAWKHYLKFHSIEIWSANIINDILTQIYYFWQHGIFKTKKDAVTVCEKVSELLIHVEQQAVVKRKFHPHLNPPKEENFELYYNDVSVSNNTILVETINRQLVFVSQNALNYLVTDHPTFFMHTDIALRHLMSSSINISGNQSSTLRHNFFGRMRSNIDFIIREIQRT